MGYPYNTLYASTYFYCNVHNIQSAIFTLSTTSVIPIVISAISIPISATSAISVIFIIPKISAIPALSTY